MKTAKNHRKILKFNIFDTKIFVLSYLLREKLQIY